MGEMAEFVESTERDDAPLYEWSPKFCRHCGMQFEWATNDVGKWVPMEMEYGHGGRGMVREHLPNCRVVGTSNLARSRSNHAHPEDIEPHDREHWGPHRDRDGGGD